jgi:mycofactocin precursor
VEWQWRAKEVPMLEAPIQGVDAASSDTEVAEPHEATQQEALVETELLVEDVSIDGMCGVY